MNKITLSICLLFLFYVTAFGQPILKRSCYIDRDGFCSTILCFINDTLYVSNSGCESSGYTHYGTYSIKEDTLLLKGGLTGLTAFVVHIDTHKTNDNRLCLKFLDQHGNNISRHFKATFVRPDQKYYPLHVDTVANVLSTGKFRNDLIAITTLDKLNCKYDRVKMDFDQGLELTYTVHIPDIVSALQLYNKNISEYYQEKLIILKDTLLPLNKDRHPFAHEMVYEKAEDWFDLH